MGTRSLTVFVDGGNELVVMYRQYDGYPSGHGVELAEFLAGMVLVNGYQAEDPRRIANGINCLAAQVIAHFKAQSPVGGFYLYPAGTRDCGEEFVYEVTGQEGGEPQITCHAVKGLTNPTLEELYRGGATEFLHGRKGRPPMPSDAAVLREFLEVAVNLRVAQYRAYGGPTADDFARASGYSELLSEHGDALFYLSKGRTAAVFNAVADGLATLAFLPGGVQAFGCRFCVCEIGEGR